MIEDSRIHIPSHVYEHNYLNRLYVTLRHPSYLTLIANDLWAKIINTGMQQLPVATNEDEFVLLSELFLSKIRWIYERVNTNNFFPEDVIKHLENITLLPDSFIDMEHLYWEKYHHILVMTDRSWYSVITERHFKEAEIIVYKKAR